MYLTLLPMFNSNTLSLPYMMSTSAYLNQSDLHILYLGCLILLAQAFHKTEKLKTKNIYIYIYIYHNCILFNILTWILKWVYLPIGNTLIKHYYNITQCIMLNKCNVIYYYIICYYIILMACHVWHYTYHCLAL